MRKRELQAALDEARQDLAAVRRLAWTAVEAENRLSSAQYAMGETLTGARREHWRAAYVQNAAAHSELHIELARQYGRMMRA